MQECAFSLRVAKQEGWNLDFWTTYSPISSIVVVVLRSYDHRGHMAWSPSLIDLCLRCPFVAFVLRSIRKKAKDVRRYRPRLTCRGSESKKTVCYRKKERGTRSPWNRGPGLGHRILGQSVTAYGKHPGSLPRKPWQHQCTLTLCFSVNR